MRHDSTILSAAAHPGRCLVWRRLLDAASVHDVVQPTADQVDAQDGDGGEPRGGGQARQDERHRGLAIARRDARVAPRRLAEEIGVLNCKRPIGAHLMADPGVVRPRAALWQEQVDRVAAQMEQREDDGRDTEDDDEGHQQPLYEVASQSCCFASSTRRGSLRRSTAVIASTFAALTSATSPAS
ncbi:MAG: hypothetical protein IT307_15635, partial [Chloroflexi bacterium]|nr:hypothetical protein [Chloroflexota bacterium]